MHLRYDVRRQKETLAHPFHVKSTWQLTNNSKLERLSLINRVNVVLNRTVVVDSDRRFDNLCGSHLQSQSELCHVSCWYYTLVIDLIGQLCRDVIGRLSVASEHYLEQTKLGGTCFNSFPHSFRYIVISQRMREKQSAHLNVIAKSIFKKLVKEQLHSLWTQHKK